MLRLYKEHSSAQLATPVCRVLALAVAMYMYTGRYEVMNIVLVV